MNNEEITKFFAHIWEVWRDLSAIEFLMRCCIMKYDNEEEYFPVPPYTKWKEYNNIPKSFKLRSFEKVTERFNSIEEFKDVYIPQDLIDLRNAMAHGIISQIGNSDVNQLIKFKNKKVDFSLELSPQNLEQLKQSVWEFRVRITERYKKI